MNPIKVVTDHPLFLTGVFPLSEVTKQDDVQIIGYYNPVTDAIFVLRFDEDEENLDHETIHRLFSRLTGGFLAFRTLGGISHNLLSYLIEVIHAKQIPITGNTLPTLRATHPTEATDFVRDIVKHLEHIENLYDLCYWYLIPPAEIAAIDFTLNENEEYTWLPLDTETTFKKRQRQEQLINAVGLHLAQENSPWYSLYENVPAELYSVWKDYISIADPSVRRELLELTMSAVLQPHPSDPERILVMDTLSLMRKYISEAQHPNSAKRFSELNNTQVTFICNSLGDRECFIRPAFRCVFRQFPSTRETAVHSISGPRFNSQRQRSDFTHPFDSYVVNTSSSQSPILLGRA